MNKLIKPASILLFVAGLSVFAHADSTLEEQLLKTLTLKLGDMAF